MGILQALRGYEAAARAAEVQAALTAPIDPSVLPFATPWGSSDLNRIAASDVFGDTIPLNTRSAAMRIPAIARGRNLLVSTIARLPLVAMRRDVTLSPELSPTWLYRTDQATSPAMRLAWTVDDLIFYGWSCWARVNSTDTRFPLNMSRVPRESWTINADNRVEIDGVVQKDDEVTLIPGLHEGILTFGLDALADARSLYGIVRSRLLSPVPQIDLHQTGGTPLTGPEIDELITRWATARQGSNGGVSFSNESIEVKPMGDATGDQLLVEARNAASLDLARVIGISAGMLDATAPKASLNYETTTGRNQEFVDFDLALYLTPIVSRLSQDDIVPAGTRVAFDLADFMGQTPTLTGPTLED